MTNLTVCDRDGVLVVDSRLIAEGLGIEHDNFLQTVQNYQTEIEQAFGIVLFETEKSGGRGRPQRYGLLTEDQATFVMTLSRNSPEVVQCKVGVVKAFSAARSAATKPMSGAEMIIYQGQLLLKIEQQQAAIQIEQQEMRVEQAKLQETILEHDAEIGRIFEPDGMLITLAGCLNLNGVHATAAQLASVGKAASKIYKTKYGKKPEKIGDARYGEVNAYPRAIAEQVLRDHGYID